MTEQESEEYQARLLWVKALDAATDAAEARIRATLASSWAEARRPAARSSMPGRVREERKAVCGEQAAAFF